MEIFRAIELARGRMANMDWLDIRGDHSGLRIRRAPKGWRVFNPFTEMYGETLEVSKGTDTLRLTCRCTELGLSTSVEMPLRDIAGVILTTQNGKNIDLTEDVLWERE